MGSYYYVQFGIADKLVDVELAVWLYRQLLLPL